MQQGFFKFKITMLVVGGGGGGLVCVCGGGREGGGVGSGAGRGNSAPWYAGRVTAVLRLPQDVNGTAKRIRPVISF